MSLEKITPKNTEYAKQTLRNRGDMFSVYILKLIESFENTEDNPIKDNRIVSDRTFAKSLKSHLKDVRAECQTGQEELDYLSGVADRLLEYQKQL